MSKTTKKITLPSLLAFERKMETSDALMYAGNWDDLPNENTKDSKKGDKETVDLWKKIPITQRWNRSTQSAYGIKDADKIKPNPVSSGNDDANLFHDTDTLKISFTLRIIGNLGLPFACNAPDFETAIKEQVTKFKKDDGSGFAVLAHRYASNIANGRFLWRNRVGAEHVKIFVEHMTTDEKNEPLIFNAYDYALNNFEGKDENLQTLACIIQHGLAGEDDFVFLKIEAYVKLGHGQHVFPSEEMNTKEKGKTLFQLENCAAMHNVKIGNALRTIDDWYEVAKFPIAAEPYGSVTQRGEAYRKSKNDLYTLMQKWVNDDKLEDNDKNYVLSNLIRGGVFSGKSASKK